MASDPRALKLLMAKKIAFGLQSKDLMERVEAASLSVKYEAGFDRAITMFESARIAIDFLLAYTTDEEKGRKSF